MAFATGRPQVRGPSLGFRFTFYATLSIVAMFLDQRHGWMEQVRFGLQAAAYPIQLAVSSPSAGWNWLQESFETREALRAENNALHAKQRELELRTMRYEALARENGELRGLRDALPPVADRWLAAEIVNIQLDSLRQRVLINRGTTNGVFKAQAVLDDKGVIGQTTHVGPFSAEVILITDPEHAIPVQIERTGLRTIAVGAGDTASLALPYLPGNADIKPGDLLLTSGLGGVFPAGYPVAKVAEVHRDAVQPLALVKAIPFASVNTDREVVLVWFREDHPAAPASTSAGDLPVGNKNLQPQPAPPPRPKAPTHEQAPAPSPGAPPSGSPTAAGTNSTGTPSGTPANASTGARKPATGPGTVNSTPAPSSNTGTAPASASDRATPAKPKEPAAGEVTPAAPKLPEPSSSATPRSP
ncbi:MAG TPA: rod shape-determining protein MreC [Steroidobacteraceae bacterium]|nr:rod shape-determining protein MreC [Steroidobacteraceae bacterium]